MSATIVTLASVLGSPVASFISESIKNYLLNKKKLKFKVQCIVMPAKSGKTTLVQSFKKDFNMISQDVIILDVEDSVLSDPANHSIVDTLRHYQTTDIHQYNVIMFPLCMAKIASTQQMLAQTKNTKKMVILVSSLELKRYLNLTGSIIFVPSKKLFQTVLANHSHLAEFITMSRELIEYAEKKHVVTFSSYEELAILFYDALGVKAPLEK